MVRVVWQFYSRSSMGVSINWSSFLSKCMNSQGAGMHMQVHVSCLYDYISSFFMSGGRMLSSFSTLTRSSAH